MARPSVVGADDQITVRMPSSLAGKLRGRALELGVTGSALARVMIECHLDDPLLAERVIEEAQAGTIPVSPSELIVVRGSFNGE